MIFWYFKGWKEKLILLKNIKAEYWSQKIKTAHAFLMTSSEIAWAK